MQTQIIDGKKLAEEIQTQLAVEVATFRRAPRLAVILVGNNPASQIYVKHKQKAAEKVGIQVDVYAIAEDITEGALISFIQSLNKNKKVDGVMVQLPLPKKLDAYRVLESIDPEKDVDGLGSRNLGKLFTGYPGLIPCTPLACMALIRSVLPKMDGLRAVVVGRSCLVGKPVAQLLLGAQCTVTQAHSHTKDLEAVCKEADILIVATGCPKLINRKHVKKGAVIIDVGISRSPDGTLCGDVDFDDVRGIAGAITPVPGGVGPMTVTMLLQNIVNVFVKKIQQKKA